ncbi:MAG: peptidoglycan DD-metalloendopeptidase family protein [Bacteroidota bacterium]
MKQLCLFLILSLVFLPLAWSQLRIPAGGGSASSENLQGICLSPLQRQQDWEEIQSIRKRLIQQGKLKAVASRQASVPPLNFPLRQKEGAHYSGYFGIANYVDHDNGSGLQEFTCGNRTYDGHHGTDYFLWPFPWDMMARGEVEIIAAAAGTIISKIDGNFDKNCSWENTGGWNAVYIEHDDGTIAWYGHIKKNTLTNKAIGDRVNPGDYLGLVGSSGRSTGPHLHLEFFTPSGATYDPYLGTCNPTTQLSGWEEQAPYIQPTLNFIQTGDGPPDLSGECLREEFINASSEFRSGERVYFSSYFVDQLPDQSATYKVYRPNGQVWVRWTFNPPQRFNASWWYWWEDLPPNADQGIWTYEVVFEGDTLTQAFSVDVDVVSSTTSVEEGISIGPNPFETYLNVADKEGSPILVTISDICGRLVKSVQIHTEKSLVEVSTLPKGIYFVALHNRKGKQLMVSKMVKK